MTILRGDCVSGSVEQKKGADGGMDGKVFFRDDPDSKQKPEVILLCVKRNSG